ncbi:MAG: hypothetical protein K2X97_13845, partial [Mycobacteriaceae bacterium]|nr:hypothetical protein [Mycobacteriaceae bacterium]
MAIQANLTDEDFRAYRHWFAIPVPSSQLKFGELNSIKIANADERAGVSIYGDYLLQSANSGNKADGVQCMPSVTALSWNHAVESCEYSDPVEFRFPDLIDLQGHASEAVRLADGKEVSDLSSSPGHQWGRYRIRVLVRPLSAKEKAVARSSVAVGASPNVISKLDRSSTSDSVKRHGTSSIMSVVQETRTDSLTTPSVAGGVDDCSSINLTQASQEHLSDGGNPATFYLTPGSMDVSKAVAGHNLVRFSCDLRTEKHQGVAFINVIFTNGSGNTWVSTSQPDCIPVNKEWKNFCFQDVLPPEICTAGKVSAQVIVTPFTHDLLFARQRKAMKRKVFTRHARLEFS